MSTLLSRILGASAISCLGVLAGASADCQRLIASNNPDLPNSFVLEFAPEMGGTRTANISRTDMILELCPDTGQARFIDYYQEAEPLILPDGSSTGDLTILVANSQSVGYTVGTGVFETLDLYEIHFAGDLSAFSLTSPFVLPDNSQGTVVYETPGTGTITMQWTGGAALPNPFVPGEFIPFSYTCNVNQRFVVAEPCANAAVGCDQGDVDASCSVDLADLSIVLANFGSSGPRVRPSHGDTNFDQAVDLTDLSRLLSQFGNDCN